MDYSATTMVLNEVIEEMKPYFDEFYGNPSSVYSFSMKSKIALDEARNTIAGILNCKSEEIFFTSGGTESDNWALIGTAIANKEKGKHIITTTIEHHAILNACKFLESQGFEITYLPVDAEGLISIDALKESIRKDTILVSIMTANNEIGTIEPISEVGKILKEKNIIFHTDAVQAVGHMKLDVSCMNVDLMSVSGHKIYAPKGIGILYIKRGTKISNLIYGGQQQRGKRSGTENIPYIVGISKAFEVVYGEFERETERQKRLRDIFIDEALKLPNVKLNGPRGEKRLSNNINLCFNGKDGEGILINLDMAGVCASSGSACSAGAIEPSHVLTAIGLSRADAKSSVRFTIGKFTTEEDINYTINKLCEILK
ncbi:cysteine desulfurase family protein [Clostridium neuense]|uniref:cysteine desulfurase n=2 Tax=Clostridium neuense TaxID=1728934 RepID=A0ABW8TGZ0_9CLOT